MITKSGVFLDFDFTNPYTKEIESYSYELDFETVMSGVRYYFSDVNLDGTDTAVWNMLVDIIELLNEDSDEITWLIRDILEDKSVNEYIRDMVKDIAEEDYLSQVELEHEEEERVRKWEIEWELEDEKDLDESLQDKKCCICGKEIKGYGNNANPVKDGTCCDKCNMEVVIPARLKQYKSLKEAKSLDRDYVVVNHNGKGYDMILETSKTRDYHREDITIRIDNHEVGFGRYKWSNRPWQRFTYASALVKAVVDWQGESARKEIEEIVKKFSSVKEAFEKFIKTNKLTESFDKEDILSFHIPLKELELHAYTNDNYSIIDILEGVVETIAEDNLTDFFLRPINIEISDFVKLHWDKIANELKSSKFFTNELKKHNATLKDIKQRLIEGTFPDNEFVNYIGDRLEYYICYAEIETRVKVAKPQVIKQLELMFKNINLKYNDKYNYFSIEVPYKKLHIDEDDDPRQAVIDLIEDKLNDSKFVLNTNLKYNVKDLDYETFKYFLQYDLKDENLTYNESLVKETLTEDIDAVRKLYPKIDETMFTKIISLDPTFNPSRNSVGTYGKWLLNLFNKDKLSENDLKQVNSLLKEFEEKKKWIEKKDIGQYKSLEDLKNVLEDTEVGEVSHARKIKDVRKRIKGVDLVKDADLVYEDSKWLVLIPKTYEASCKLGENTRWCTASKENDRYYRQYTEDGDLYIIINKNDENEKYQFHFETKSYMDEDDYYIDLDYFLNNNEGLKEFFNDKLYGWIDEYLEQFREGDEVVVKTTLSNFLDIAHVSTNKLVDYPLATINFKDLNDYINNSVLYDYWDNNAFMMGLYDKFIEDESIENKFNELGITKTDFNNRFRRLDSVEIGEIIKQSLWDTIEYKLDDYFTYELGHFFQESLQLKDLYINLFNGSIELTVDYNTLKEKIKADNIEMKEEVDCNYSDIGSILTIICELGDSNSHLRLDDLFDYDFYESDIIEDIYYGTKDEILTIFGGDLGKELFKDYNLNGVLKFETELTKFLSVGSEYGLIDDDVVNFVNTLYDDNSKQTFSHMTIRNINLKIQQYMDYLFDWCKVKVDVLNNKIYFTTDYLKFLDKVWYYSDNDFTWLTNFQDSVERVIMALYQTCDWGPDELTLDKIYNSEDNKK